MNKLEPIAELIKNMLEEKFNIEAKYSFEEKKDWLLNVPNRDLYNEFWDDISYTYNKLVDNKLGLDEQLSLINDYKLKAKARIDIWFEEPYNFICEFDETQHFNQFRQMTLGNSYKSFNYSFDYQYYLDICKSSVLKVGTGGFYKLRSEDLLFPKMHHGEKQDNRLRQRAFRDFLKDIVPESINVTTTNKFIEGLKIVKLFNWKAKYIEPEVCDGTQWSIEIITEEKKISKHGDNKFPEEWDIFCKLIRDITIDESIYKTVKEREKWFNLILGGTPQWDTFEINPEVTNISPGVFKNIQIDWLKYKKMLDSLQVDK